jgi:hypothetical protein
VAARLLLSLLALALAPLRAAAADLELLMFEQPGCVYCAAWDQEIAPQYPLTTEGKAAPLRRLQLRAPLPPDLALDRPPVFTPTFVLMADGVETGRIEGYPGADFFWPLLAELITEAAAN